MGVDSLKNMSRFIVTGATGFVGSMLCKKLLDDGHKVYIISRENSDLSLLSGILNKVDLFRYDGEIDNLIQYFCEIKADCVFHLASLFIPEHKSSDIDWLTSSNLKFGTEILEAMRLSETKNIINTGTAWQHYENEAYNPVCLYAATKQAFEAILDFYVKAYGFRSLTLKLFDVYGENDTRQKLINQLKNISNSNQELKLSEGYQKIDFIHIDDVIKAYICAWRLLDQTDFNGHQDYGVCTGRLITLREFIAKFEEINGVHVNVKFGERPYRQREVMEPWREYTLLPNWTSSITLEDGLKRLFNDVEN